MRSALTRYRVLAYATGVFLLLLTAHVIVQYAQSVTENVPFSEEPGLGRWLPGGDAWIPITHGYLYLIYVVCALDLWFRTRTIAPGEASEGHPKRRYTAKMALVVLAGTIPGMSFVAERWVTARIRPLLGQPAPASMPTA
jgi:integral membrane protein